MVVRAVGEIDVLCFIYMLELGLELELRCFLLGSLEWVAVSIGSPVCWGDGVFRTWRCRGVAS